MTWPADGIRLPWSGRDMPHAALDLLRGCNIVCDGCYNATAEFRPKPAAQLSEELRQLMGLRRLQTVTLTGGETLLHPAVCEIVRDAKACGLRTVLLTNGVLLDDSVARRLKEAGLDMVLLHIQSRQKRPDLLPAGRPIALKDLRREKAVIAVAAGLEVGYSAVMYPDANGHAEIRELLQEVASSEIIHFLLVCPQGEFATFTVLEGDIESGYSVPQEAVGMLPTEEGVSTQGEALYGLLREAGFGLSAWVGSSVDIDEPRWSAWNAGVLKRASVSRVIPLHPAWTDRLLMQLPRLLTGRHVFHVPASTTRFRVQLALGLLGRGSGRASFPLLAGSLRAGTQLFRKHVVVELAPVRRTDGTLVICRECPDATIRGGRLVPPCIADRLPELGKGSSALITGTGR